MGGAAAKEIILSPFATEGTDVAIVWIHGADCENSAYLSVAQQVQSEGAKNGQKIWVGLPEFPGDMPEPLLMDKEVDHTIEKLRESGFTGDNILLAGHSLGGVMTQRYAGKHADTVKGAVLMGSVLLRSHHSINDDGTTHFDYDVPTLTIAGTKDGLMRISRAAESYWHQVENIEEAQQGLFPVVAIEGGSHMSFMSGEAPKAVAKKDLRPQIDEDEAHQ